MPTNLFILIFIASPLDYACYRHAALYFEFESYAQDAETGNTVGVETPSHLKSSLMEVVGSDSEGGYVFSERVNSDLSVESRDLARVIRVSSIHDSIPVSTLRDLVSTTPLSTSEGGDWNSQNWVGDALARLVAAGYLDGRDRDRGLDEMVDVVVEAGDEERRFRIE